MAETIINLTDNSEIKVKDKKPKKVKPYSENEALQRGQKKYFEKNKEMILQKRREIYKRWVESQDIEDVRAKQREKSRKYYQNKKMLKELQKSKKKISSFKNLSLLVV